MDDYYSDAQKKCKERCAKKEDNPSCQKCTQDIRSMKVKDLKTAPDACPMLDSSKQIMESFTKTWNGVSASLTSTFRIGEELQRISKMALDLEKMSGISRIQAHIKEIQRTNDLVENALKASNWISQLDLGTSPIVNTAMLLKGVVRPLPTLPKSSYKFLFSKYKPEIRSAISDLKTGEDPIHNIEAYRCLFQLERFLRCLISDVIPAKEWDTRIPKEMRDQWAKRQKDEFDNMHCDHTLHKLIEYSDFTELKIILEKGNNKLLFKDILSEEDLKVITTKLHELDPIRKKIAHSRLISKREFDMIVSYSEQIMRIMQKTV